MIMQDTLRGKVGIDELDKHRHKGLRKVLIDELKAKNVGDEKVWQAMGKIPRHLFLESALDYIAYQDVAFPIGCDQTISHPSTVAFQSQLLDVQIGEKILEIGTGSGYQTSVLCELGARVFSIERQKILHVRAKSILDTLKYRAKCFYGDGYKGLVGYAPFDKIIITCGAQHIPTDLIKQLKIGGLMIIPLGQNSQTMYRLTKISETELRKEEFGNYKFVPMLEEKSFE